MSSPLDSIKASSSRGSPEYSMTRRRYSAVVEASETDPRLWTDSATCFPFSAKSCGEGEQRLVRTDLPVPVVRAHTETDVNAGLFGASTQEDTETFRYYEMAGTAHATLHLNAPFGLPFLLEALCEFPSNTLADGPVFGSFLFNAMWENMERQVVDDVAPPHGALIERDAGGIARDPFGNALGGVRLPELDVPVARYEPSNTARLLPPQIAELAELFCRLAGAAIPFDSEQLEVLYPTPESFLSPYEESADALVAERFLLPEDADTLKTIEAPEPGITALSLGAVIVLALAALRRVS